jgi:hypothetical protein
MKKMLFLSLVVSSLLGNANFASANEASSVDQSFDENGVLFLKKGDQEIVLIKKSDISKQQALKLSQEEGFHVVDVTNRRSWKTFFNQVWNSKAWSAWELKAVGLLNMEKVFPVTGEILSEISGKISEFLEKNKHAKIIKRPHYKDKTMYNPYYADLEIRRDLCSFFGRVTKNISINNFISKIFSHKSVEKIGEQTNAIFNKTRDLFHVYAGIALFIKLSYSVMSQEGKMEGLSLETQSALKKQLSKVAFIINESDRDAVSKLLAEKSFFSL